MSTKTISNPFETITDGMAEISNQIQDLKNEVINLKKEQLRKPKVTDRKPPISKRDAAKYIGTSQRTIDRLKDVGVIPYLKVGAKVLFKLRDLDTYLEECTHKTW